MHQSNSTPEVVAQQLYELLRPALQRWGRYASTDYPAFREIAVLRLPCVESHAAALIRATGRGRTMTDADRQRAVWHIVRQAIENLCPPAAVLSPPIRAAMSTFPKKQARCVQ